MYLAQEDDAGLYGVEERWGGYREGPYVPQRWRGVGAGGTDPKYMDDEEYAEWVRGEMWK